jgi:hypothetical protein
MTRNLKNLGILVGALLAFCSLVASTASAHVPGRFTLEQDTTTVTGVGVEGGSTFTVTGNTVTCSTEEFHGHVSTPANDTSATSITITPTYTGCTAFGFVGAKVTGFGHYGEAERCDYTFTAEKKVDLRCPAGRDVTIDAGTCIVHVPAQNELSFFTPTTDTKEVVGIRKHDLRIHIEVSDITVTHTDGFACPLPSGGESATASLVGKATAWGEDPETGALLGITWDVTIA